MCVHGIIEHTCAYIFESRVPACARECFQRGQGDPLPQPVFLGTERDTHALDKEFRAAPAAVAAAAALAWGRR